MSSPATLSPELDKRDIYDVPSIDARRNSDNVVVHHRKRLPWYGHVWDSFGKEREERNFLLKLDFTLLVFSVLGLIMRYIDQKNVDQAFVSGMKEDLNMFGLEYNYAQTCWTVGYVIGQIPTNMLLNRVSPHYVIFALEFSWSILTLGTTWITGARQLYVVRFFVGLAEAGYYPGLLFLIGSWYTKDELAKRSNIFQAATAGGTLLSGVMQGGIHRELDGVRNLAGWRWMFLIDACISIPIATGAFFFIPDLPTKIKPSWIFSASDIAIGQRRMRQAGRDGPKSGSFNWKLLKEVLATWHIWVFTALYSAYIVAQNPQQSMSFWLKQSPAPLEYTVEQINYYPCGIWATQIVSALGFAWLSDTVLGGRRWPPLLLVALWHTVDLALLAGLPVYPTNRVPRWVLYYLSGVVNCTPGLLYAWCSEIIGSSSEKRAIVMATFNCVAFSFNAWLPLLLFKQTEQPRVLKGTIATSVFSAAQFGLILLVLYFSRRDERRAIAGGGSDKSVESKEGSEDEEKKGALFEN